MRKEAPKKSINGVEYSLKEHEVGFFQLDPLPSEKELNEYYQEMYYQNPQVATYQKGYSSEELNLNAIQYEMTKKVWSSQTKEPIQSVLDIGCGEGFFLNEFDKRGVAIAGNDYSTEGIRAFNPHLENKIFFGAAEGDIEERKKKNQEFDIINLGNVLEHVLDPVKLLSDVRPLLADNGLFRVVVPNDASSFQQLLRARDVAEYEWFHPLDHISYFSFETLPKLVKHCGYDIVEMLGDFPIELFLLNEASNYIINKETGKFAHQARVLTSNHIYDQGLEAYLQWSRGLAAGQIGRVIVCFIRKVN